jgi:outer membrane protein
MKTNFLAGLALLVAVAALVLAFTKGGSLENRIAFVDTNRMMTGFSEAHKANNEIKLQDEKWKVNLKILDDSLKSFMDSMTVRFDHADLKEKRSLQDELAMRNQQINNYTAAQTKKMEEAAQKRLASVYEKVNAYMKEYGKSKGYYVVFGTASGSILYGEGSPLDITDEVLKGLNKRYE